MEIGIGGRTVHAMVLPTSLFFAGLLFGQSPQADRTNSSSQSDSVDAVERETDSLPAKNLLGNPELDALRISGRVVTENGSPAIDATVFVKSGARSRIDAVFQTDADGRSVFDIRVDRGNLPNVRFGATSKDEYEVGYYRFTSSSRTIGSNEFIESESIEIELEGLKEARVRVVDATGRAIPSANVAIQLEYPHVLLDFITDKDGIVTIPMPRSESIETVVAWKAGEGLDSQKRSSTQTMSGLRGVHTTRSKLVHRRYGGIGRRKFVTCWAKLNRSDGIELAALPLRSELHRHGKSLAFG